MSEMDERLAVIINLFGRDFVERVPLSTLPLKQNHLDNFAA